LEAISRTAAEEEGEHGIEVLLFNPGAIRSGMHATGDEPETVIPKLLVSIQPLGKPASSLRSRLS
jgi:NAD(P)-dependent dehydrogenase (short-subunit alcohol dehydrogenase family)